MTPTRRNVMILVDHLGATYRETALSHGWDVTIEAPRNHHWGNAGVHERVYRYHSDKPSMYAAIIADLKKEKLDRCDDEVCPANSGEGCEWWAD